MDYLGSIKTLKLVYDCQSYSRASKELFISQPAVSKKIKNLEEFYETQLIIKKDNRIELTKVGSLVYDEAKKLDRIHTNTQILIQREIEENSKDRIGLPELFFVKYVLDNQNDKAEYIVEKDPYNLIEKFNAGVIDQLVINDNFEKLVKFEKKTKLEKAKVNVLASKELQFTGEEKVDDLAQYRILLCSNHSSSEIIEKYLEENARVFGSVKFIDNFDKLIAECVLDPKSITLVSEDFIMHEDVSKHLELKETALPEIEVCLYE